MATSFNGTTFKWISTGGTPPNTPDKEIGLDSLTFGGGDVSAVDFTSAGSLRKLQEPGFRSPYQITITGKATATSGVPIAGDYIDWAIAENSTVSATGTGWYVESIEVSGSVDEANSVNLTIIEGN